MVWCLPVSSQWSPPIPVSVQVPVVDCVLVRLIFAHGIKSCGGMFCSTNLALLAAIPALKFKGVSVSASVTVTVIRHPAYITWLW